MIPGELVMYSKSEAFYDAIYGSMKDYAKEAALVHALIQQYKRTPGNRLLDVACGTGAHIAFLQRDYTVEGLDLDEEMLAIARQRNPAVTFHHGDMVDFDLGHTFDVVMCLFSSIGYTNTLQRLQQALQTMRRHLNPGGVLLIEPWLAPEMYKVGHLSATLVNQPDLKIARMNKAEVEGRVSVMDFHYLVATPA